LRKVHTSQNLRSTLFSENSVDAEVPRKRFGKEILTAPWEGVSSFCYDVTAPAQRHYKAGATKGFQRMRSFHPPVKPVDWLKSGLA
jgi:hypothetical protein